jgi:WD40 repeat protein
MLSEVALLSSSVQYGIVARSFPFNGKVVKGFLNASGMHHGMGIGNPNAEFMPDVTACAISSESSSAKILWGRRDGRVSVMWHSHTMSGSRAAAKIHESRVEEEHRGAINDAIFVADNSACVTVGADGVAKLWSLKRFSCVWTSPRGSSEVPDAFVKVVDGLAYGVLVCATAKGDIIVFSGFDLAAIHAPTSAQSSVSLLRVSASSTTNEPADIKDIFLKQDSHSVVSILIRNDNSPTFQRHRVDLSTGFVTKVSYGDPPSGIVHYILPVFGTHAQESSFVVAGHRLGSLTIYEWVDNSFNDQVIGPVERIEVFADSPITCIAANPFVIAAGSSRGSIRVIDALTFEPLKSFAAPVDQNVRRIILRRDTLIAAVGSRVLAWKGAPVSSHGAKAIKAKGKAKQEFDKKWQSMLY